jgi:hypothetical protein
VTQTHNNTIPDAVFTSAWTEFCRTNGSQEYWRRYGDYLFTDPKREIPRELLSLPPGYRPPPTREQAGRRQRKPSPARLLAKAKQLGVDVTVEPDGRVTFHTGTPPPSNALATDSNPWDAEEERLRQRALQ